MDVKTLQSHPEDDLGRKDFQRRNQHVSLNSHKMGFVSGDGKMMRFFYHLKLIIHSITKVRALLMTWKCLKHSAFYSTLFLFIHHITFLCHGYTL